MEYEDDWRTSYDIIDGSKTAGIPNIAGTKDCDKVCQLVPRHPIPKRAYITFKHSKSISILKNLVKVAPTGHTRNRTRIATCFGPTMVWNTHLLKFRVAAVALNHHYSHRKSKDAQQLPQQQLQRQPQRQQLHP